jgi:hypothetical protein
MVHRKRFFSFTATGVLLLFSHQSFAELITTPGPDLWVTPQAIDFGPVGVGETSPKIAVTITNTGDETLSNFAGGSAGAPFNATQNCAAGVAPGASCQYFFTFSPTDAGDFNATSHSSTNAGPIAIEMHGQGVGAKLHVTPLALDFGSVKIGNSASSQKVTIRNTGLGRLENFAGGSVNAPFSATQNCVAGVAPGDTCQYTFGFSPTTTGSFSTTSNSSTNAGSIAIDLQGRGRSTIFGSGQRVTPRSLNFGPVGVGNSGDTLVVTVTNQSLVAITNFTGGGVSAPFNATQNCAPSLSVGASCHFSYTFNPTEVGTFTTTSNVSNSAGSFSIELQGEAVGSGLSVSALVLDFGPVKPGDTGTPQIVTVKNTGLATLTEFAGGGVSSPFSAGQNCAGGVAPGGTCHFTYNFHPTQGGHFTATSTVSTNAGPFSITLQGGAPIDIAVTPDPLQFGSIAIGTTGTQTETLYNTGKGDLIVNGITTSTPPFTLSGSTCSGSFPFTLTSGTNCALIYAFDPDKAGTASQLITLVSNAPASADNQFTLQGTGVLLNSCSGKDETIAAPLIYDHDYYCSVPGKITAGGAVGTGVSVSNGYQVIYSAPAIELIPTFSVENGGKLRVGNNLNP